MEHHSMSAGEFKDRYGVTPQEVQDALDENRRRVGLPSRVFTKAPSAFRSS